MTNGGMSEEVRPKRFGKCELVLKLGGREKEENRVRKEAESSVAYSTW